MLLRLSRLSIGLAAAAAGLAVIGPQTQRMLCIDVAVALGAAGFVLWRMAIALHTRFELQPVEQPGATPIDPSALRDAEGLVRRAVAAAPSFEVGLHRAIDVLRGELGARATRAFLVSDCDAGCVLSELIACQPSFRVPPRACAAHESGWTRALHEGRPCLDLPRAVVVPVLADGRTVALFELTGIEMAIDREVLGSLLLATQDALGSRNLLHDAARSDVDAVHESSADAPAIPWPGRFEPRTASGGFAC